jgi:hypothetical protein
MNVLLGGDQGPEKRACTWYPDANNSVFPLLLETKEGHLFRLVNRIGEIRPDTELLFMIEVFTHKAPSRAIDEIVGKLGDELEPELRTRLLQLLEPFQRHMDGLARMAGEQQMRINDLEGRLLTKNEG